MSSKVYAYGIIPLRQFKKRWQLLLVTQVQGHVSFPKGRWEEGEKPQETAQRELFEETGLKVVAFLPLTPFEDGYTVSYNGCPVAKSVIYYPAIVEGIINLEIEEISRAEWVDLQEASSRLTFASTKMMVETLKKLLTTFKNGLRTE